MKEIWTGTIPAIQMLLILIGSFLYMRGGRGDKWIRRYLGSLVMAVACWVGGWFCGTFHWSHLFIYPLISFVFHLGYSNRDGRGWLKRISICLVSLMPGVLLCLTIKGSAVNIWNIFALHAAIVFLTMLFRGRPTFLAPIKEYLVGFFISFPYILYPLVEIF